MNTDRLKPALKAGLIHISISIIVALILSGFIFIIWFPYPFRSLAGGNHLLSLIVIIDIVCGPLLTMVLFNPKKSKRELTLDLGIVVAIQIAALIYGIYTISLARPVALVYEVDRFVAVTKAQIDPESALNTDKKYLSFPLLQGPRLLSIRAAKDGDEALKSVELSMQGVEPSVRPNWWQEYNLGLAGVRKFAKPLKSLRDKVPHNDQSKIDEAIQSTSTSIDKLYYLPLVSGGKLDDWIILLDEQMQPIGYAPISGFQ